MEKKESRKGHKADDDKVEYIVLPPCEYAPSGEWLGPCSTATNKTDGSFLPYPPITSTELIPSDSTTSGQSSSPSTVSGLTSPSAESSLSGKTSGETSSSLSLSEKKLLEETAKKKAKETKPKKVRKRPLDRKELLELYIKEKIKEKKIQQKAIEKALIQQKKTNDNKRKYKECQRKIKEKEKEEEYKQMICNLKKERRMNNPLSKKEYNLIRKYELEELREDLKDLLETCKPAGKALPLPPCRPIEKTTIEDIRKET